MGPSPRADRYLVRLTFRGLRAGEGEHAVDEFGFDAAGIHGDRQRKPPFEIARAPFPAMPGDGRVPLPVALPGWIAGFGGRGLGGRGLGGRGLGGRGLGGRGLSGMVPLTAMSTSPASSPGSSASIVMQSSLSLTLTAGKTSEPGRTPHPCSGGAAVREVQSRSNSSRSSSSGYAKPAPDRGRYMGMTCSSGRKGPAASFAAKADKNKSPTREREMQRACRTERRIEPDGRHAGNAAKKRLQSRVATALAAAWQNFGAVRSGAAVSVAVL